MHRRSATVWWAACVALALAAASMTWVVLDEAYGAGPPYYGRTTNMDKWTSPLPLLLVVEGPLFALSVLCGLRARRLRDRASRDGTRAPR